MGKIRAAITVAALVAGLGGAALLGAGAASAQGTPTPWINSNGTSQDPSAVGGLTFYDASGNPITSGPSSTSSFAAFTQGRVPVRTGTDNHATLSLFVPVSGVTPDGWLTNQTIGGSTIYPVSTPASLAGSTLPVNTGGAGDHTLTSITGGFPASGDPGVYEVRMYVSGPSRPLSSAYDFADISITSTGWSLVYTPDAPVTTHSSLVAAPSPGITGQNVTLTASELQTPVVTGSYQFLDGVTSLATQAVSGAGVATFTTNTLALGSHSLSAVFTPSNPANTGDTATATESIQNPAIPTSTALSVGGSTQFTGTDVTFTATVTTGTNPLPAGHVDFVDNGAATPFGSVAFAGGASPQSVVLDEPTGLAATGHSVVATYVPNGTAYNGSSSAAQTFTTSTPLAGACTQTGSQCQDQQFIEATIPVGTLVITTPYTNATTNVLNLGPLALQTNATEYKGSAAFQNIIITDTRAGNLPYTVTALSSNLTDGGSNAGSTINSQNVGLTGLTSAGSAGFAGGDTEFSNPAADPAVGPTAVLGAVGQQGLGINPHTIVTAPHGLGTLTLNGTLTITAPTSTEAGLFTGTILFTVG